MSLYLPRAFDEADLSRLDALADRYDFASLTTIIDGEPFASHVPVLYRRDGENIGIRGHLARPNAQARSAANALLMLHGPSAYVSPGWYPDKLEQARVPTWNYVVAHLHGELELFEDEASLAAIVTDLAERHEPRVGGDWRFDLANPAERVQLQGITGFRMSVQRLQLKAKLSQNHPEPNRRAVASNLLASHDASAREVGALMSDMLATQLTGERHGS